MHILLIKGEKTTEADATIELCTSFKYFAFYYTSLTPRTVKQTEGIRNCVGAYLRRLEHCHYTELPVFNVYIDRVPRSSLWQYAGH